MKHTLSGVSIARIATVPFFLYTQLKSQIVYLAEAGMDVTMISGEGEEVSYLPQAANCRHVTIDIPRRMDIYGDMLAICRLYTLFKREKYLIVHSTTPKAGLASAIAGALAGVPIRLHTFTGQPWITMKGPVGVVARLADRIIGRLNTRCYADSNSQRLFLVENGIVQKDRIDVIGSGSLAGVDMKRFNKDLMSIDEKTSLRESLSITGENIVLIYIGRVTKEKGVCELLSVMNQLKHETPSVVLLVVGPLDEEVGGKGGISKAQIEELENVRYVGYTSEPEKYIAISDVLCLPSYREGFGTVVIEAAAMFVPTIGTNINGLRDAVVDGETGILVEPRDIGSLSSAILGIVRSPDKIAYMGQAAFLRCKKLFNMSTINKLLLEEYLRLVGTVK